MGLLLHSLVRERDSASDFSADNASCQLLNKSRPLPIPMFFLLPGKKLITTCQPMASTHLVSSNPSPCSLQWKYSNHFYIQLLQYRKQNPKHFKPSFICCSCISLNSKIYLEEVVQEKRALNTKICMSHTKLTDLSAHREAFG